MTYDRIIEGEPIDSHLRELLNKWWTPPAELISTLPKGGVELQYLDHAQTTRALSECDPEWTWEPMGINLLGTPVIDLDEKGQMVGLWIYLTVWGVKRPCYGSCAPGKSEAVKELIGDAIRNGAMRFGVAGALWSKADRDTPAKAKREPKALPEIVEPPSASAGQKAYDALVKEYGKEVTDGALATHGVARYSELTPAKVKVLTSSLQSRAIVEQLNEDYHAAASAD